MGMKNALFALLIALTVRCSEPAPTTLGAAHTEALSAAPVTSFEAMKGLDEGAEVVVAGTIGEVCPAGCWFYLHGPSDLVYVDVAGEFSVPERARGAKARVRGNVAGQGGARTLHASQVLFEPQ